MIGAVSALKLSVVVPALNEQENIPHLYAAVTESTASLCDELELIFVDDGSTDQSAALVRDMHFRDPRVKLLSLSRNFGHQIALTAGMDFATGDAVVFMDADLQHPPHIIAQLVEHWRQGYDIVFTIRESTSAAGWLKRFTAAAFYKLFRVVTRIDLPMNAADFRLLDRRVVDAFMSIRERARFLRGLTSWVGFRSVGLAYHAEARRAGRSKYNLARMLKLALDGIVSFSPAPLYLSFYLGFALAILGFLYAIYVLYVKLFTDTAVQGWTSLGGLVSLVGGVQLISVGLLGVYLGKVYDEVKQRPIYLLREARGFGENDRSVTPRVPAGAVSP